MIKEILDLFRSESQLEQAYNRSMEMLQTDRKMFEAAIRSLRERDDAKLDVDIYTQDQRINAYEREVRRKVLTHLSVAGERDVSAALILVSVVIDIERIGDYTKNIVELALHHPERLECGRFEEIIRKIETTVKTSMTLLVEALPESDEGKCKEVMSEHWWIARRSDEIVNSLIEQDEPGLSGRDGVATAMYARYLKRVSAHLKNVASSVVNPFDRIGFRSEGPNNR